MNLAVLLQNHAATRGDAAALIVETARGPQRLSFAELDEAGARAAAFLRSCGLNPGDTVLVFVPMSLDLYVALAAIFRSGLVAMFVDPSAGWRRLNACCEQRPPRALIASPKAHLLRFVSRRLESVPVKFVVGRRRLPGATPWSRAAAAAPWREIATVSPEHPALATFTSGSTGEPKLLLRTHGFLRRQQEVLQKCLRSQPGEVDLATMPIVLLANLAAGVTSLIPHVDLRRPGRVDAARLARQMNEHAVATAVASPALLERLTAHCAPRGIAFPALRRVATGGAPVHPRLLAELQALAPEAEVLAVYGSSEAEPIARLTAREITPDDRQAIASGAGLLAGRPVDDVDLRIVPDRWGRPIGPFRSAEFASVCLPHGLPGEIVVRGPHVLAGAAGCAAESTSFRVDEGAWHRTGDAGALDARGRLWLLGRCAARFADGHATTYPLAAEAPFYDDPAVRRAALVAVGGRRIMLLQYVDRRRRAAADAQRLAHALGLDEARACRAIPVDARHNSKIDYPRLRRMIGSGGT